METEKQEIINKVRILADLQNNNNPTNYATNRFAKIKCGDSVMFEFALLNGGKLVDTSQLQTLTLEIMDIGSLNAPLPRTVKLLATKTISKNDIVEIDNIAEFENGKYNAQFLFASTETIWGDGHKWMSLSGYAQDGTKTTFTQGWIETFVSYCADEQIVTECESPYLRQDYADSVYLKLSSSLSDLPDTTLARNNLNVYSKSETELFVSQLKANRGEFYFGGAANNADIIKWNSFGIPLPFSLAFRLKADDSQTGTLSYLFRLSNGIFIARQSGLRVEKYTSTNTKEKTLLAPTNIEAEIFDGNWHSIIVVCTTTTLSLFYEKGVIATATGNFTDIQPNLFRIAGGGASSGFGGQMADIKIFNFDMSDNNAPYTIDDYINGKDESPLLNLGVQSYNVSDMTFSSVNQTSYPCESVSDSTADTITITTTGETNAMYTWIDGRANAIAIPQGANVEVSVGHLDVATSVQGYFYSGATRVQTLSGVSNDNPTISFIAPANLTRLSLIVHAGVNPIPTGTILTITGLKIKVNGALLSLADYTFQRNSTTKVVLDESGNGNNATIVGNVYSQKDSAISAFVNEIKNQITQTAQVVAE